MKAELFVIQENLHISEQKITQTNQEIVQRDEMIEETNQRISLYEGKQKQLLEEFLKLKGNIRVFIKVRPVLPVDYTAYASLLRDGSFDHVKLKPSGKYSISVNEQDLNFDRVYGPEEGQEEIFSEIEPLLESMKEGSDICILCYGQTGSGKTHTMGQLLPRALETLLRFATEKAASLSCSFVENYLEQVNDLLDSSNSCAHSNKFAQFEPSIVPFTSLAEAEKVLKRGEQSRKVAQNACNSQSSRSHSLFCVKLSSGGSIAFVDLAGSERLEQTKVEGQRLTESISINKSLSALSDVVLALREQEHVPFRNCKLTLILQPFLGGKKSKVVLLVNLNPVSTKESAQSLRFASKLNAVNLQ